jgi:hypothetical protein
MDYLPLRKFPIWYAVWLVLGEKLYVFLFIFLSPIISIFYLFLLPSLPNGGLEFFAIQFISPLQVFFSLIFGILLSFIIILNAYTFKELRSPSGTKTAIGGVLSTFVNVLCCTPVIPSLIALTGASTPTLFEYAPPIEAFFENYYPYFYLLSAGLMALSVYYLSRTIVTCQRRCS